MATYKEIRGVNIQSLAADPTAVEGDVWYNATTSKLKIYASSGAWSTGGTMNLARGGLGGAGTQTAFLVFGGAAPPSNTRKDECETYDGSTWSEVNDLNASHGTGGGDCGTTQTAALVWGGHPGETVNTEKWDGTNWTEVNNLNTGRAASGGAGTTTAGLCIGGNGPGGTVLTVCEEYDGTNWAETGDLNTSSSYRQGIGSQTAAFGCGGYPSDTVTNIVEEYDGTSWTETTDFNTARRSGTSAGTTSNGLLIAGYAGSPIANVESWNGSSWTEIADVSTAVHAQAARSGTGTTGTAAISAGGSRPAYTAVTEEFSFSASVETLGVDQ